MNILFNLRSRTTGKLIAQSTTFAHSKCEAEWRGGLDPFFIEAIEREGWEGLIAKSDRFGSPWPPAKIDEFCSLYEAGIPVRRLAAHFDCEDHGIIRMRNKLGLRKRMDVQDRPGSYNSLWTPDQDELINYMFDEGMSVDEITKHIARTTASVVQRIRETAKQWSERRVGPGFTWRERRKRYERNPRTRKGALQATMAAARATFGNRSRRRKGDDTLPDNPI